MGRATKKAVRSGFCRAMDLGASSPATTWRKVMQMNAMAAAMEWAAAPIQDSGRNCRRGTNRWARAGSPIHPRARLAMVMPSWVAAMKRSGSSRPAGR
jgi:hypothetical protein